MTGCSFFSGWWTVIISLQLSYPFDGLGNAKKGIGGEEMNSAYKEVLKAMERCMEACNVCYHASLKEEQPMMRCIELDRDCAEICAYSINAIQRSSKIVPRILSLCAEICEACGTECKLYDHRHCQDCAKACFQCAEECRKLI
jgi:hypothetical protein